MAAEVADEYLSSLTDLTVNSKPLINMLTMLAEENSDHAPAIVRAIESHLDKVSADVKLPVLYLIDSIVKNVAAVYVPLFTNNIVQIFSSVFEKVDEKTRMCMFKLRQTWNDIFPAKKMYTLDLRIQHMDQNWPTLSPPPTSIHVNPKFLNKSSKTATPSAVISPVVKAATISPGVKMQSDLEATVLQKQQILLELQQKKRELELLQQGLLGEHLPQAIVRPEVRTVQSKDTAKVEVARNISVPKATPRAVVMPPAPSASDPPAVRIAPATSLLIEAAKSRDPRLARMQTLQKLSENSKAFEGRNPDPPKEKKRKPAQKHVESEADLLDDLLRKQKTQAAKLAQLAAKPVEKKVPAAKVAEDLIQQRQMAMLKAPVLGQLSKKAAEGEKPPRRRTSPVRRDPRSRRGQSDQGKMAASPRSDDKPSPRSKHYKDSKSRRKPRSGSESKQDRKRDRRGKIDRKEERLNEWEEIEPQFSPEPESNGHSSPVPVDMELASPRSSPEPPPPPVIRRAKTEDPPMEIEEVKVPEPVGFKTVKGALKSRNYSRRNKERSVTPPADVDLRVAPGVVAEAAKPLDELMPSQTSTSAEELVDVGKDVDLRQLAMAPKKRLSTDGDPEEPPNKRGKADTIQLFGNCDMDERMPPRSLRTPPPPMISTTPPAGSPLVADAEASNHATAVSTWADVKPRLEAEVKPMTLSHQLEIQVADMERAEMQRQQPPQSPAAGERDQLGRLLLYSRLPNDPRARRESLHHHEDARTDAFPDAQEDLHVDDILVQAKEQLSRGTMSVNQYNLLMAQIVRMNENQKIRDAQRQRRRFRDTNGSPPFHGPARPYGNDPDFRPNAPWRTHPDEDEAPYARRWRGGPHGGPGGPRGRKHGGGPRWRDARFPRLQGGHSPDWIEPDSRSQEACMPGVDAVPIPPTDPCALEAIALDPVRSISIDGMPRSIRYYGEIAVAMLSFNSTREISFEGGVRRVFIAGLEIPCQLNGPPMPFLFQKNTHTVRLGAPTRELYVDDRFYEVHFGGAPSQAELAGVPCSVQLEGPPPQVRIAPRGNNFCLGSVILIVDATNTFTIYLDAKPQRFEINGRPLVLKLANRLATVLINDVPVPLQFNGCPVQVNICDSNHFLRLTELPPGIEVGKVNIRGMDGLDLHDSNSQEMPYLNQDIKPELPEPGTDLNRGMYMEMLSSTMSAGTEGDTKVGFNYQVEPVASLPPGMTAPPMLPPMGIKEEPSSGIPMNLSNLLQSLVATGLISNKLPEPDVKQDLPVIKRVDFNDANSLNERQPGVIGLLYSGIQCGSCGVRFPPQETVKYSRHLDWHFRQNRRDRDAARRGSSRRWYYDLNDWIQFAEFEDLEEREQSWFETEAQGQGEEVVEEEEMRSVRAPTGRMSVCCHVCHDRFDTFFHEETEEWHLRHCVSIDDKFYHPACYQDSVKVQDEPLAVEKMEHSEITMPPMLAPLKVEAPPVMEQSVVLLVDDEDEDDVGDVEIVTADDEAVQALTTWLVDQVVMLEECYRSPIEDDELEVLAVPSKEDKPPVDVIDVPEAWDDEHFRPPSPVAFDPNRKIKLEPVDEMESPVAQVDQTIVNVVSSIDGNVEMAETPAAPAPTASKIKITFTKPQAPEPLKKVVDDVIDPSELQIEEIDPAPLPMKPKKPRIAEREMIEYPPCQRGTEISGLCSIM